MKTKRPFLLGLSVLWLSVAGLLGSCSKTSFDSPATQPTSPTGSVVSQAAEDPTAIAEPEQNTEPVYVAPTGKRYHYEKSCAGENAVEVPFYIAAELKTPCPKCAN